MRLKPLTLIGALALMATWPACAQDAAPGAPIGAPIQTVPTPQPDQGLLPTAPPTSTIQTEELHQLDAWSVGALSRDRGGLESNLWAGTDPMFLASLFDRLPATYESPATRALAQRVVLSGGDAPAGDAQAAVRKRFEALGKMGAAEELATMAAGSGPGLTDPVIAQYAAQAELARGRRADACARGRAASSTPPAPFILRLRAYCAGAGGDRAAANLALELIHGTSPDDVWYASAISAAAGAPGARLPAARYDNSLTAQISLSANLRAGPNPLANASNLALLTLARADATPQPVRAQAAALAFRRGLIGVADARAAMEAPADATGLPPIALALRQVKAAPGTLAAGTAISGVLQAARAPADFFAAARFFKDDIAALTTAPDPASTLLYARAAIVTGDVALATRLTGSARQAGVDQAALAPVDAALAVLASFANPPDAGAPKRRIDAAGAAFARQAARDVTIFAAVGFPLDAPTQAFLTANPPQGGTAADPAVMIALDAAVARHSTGETGLLAVLACGVGPSRLDAASLAHVITALRNAGFEGDAKRFAIEALLAGAPA